MASPFLFFLWIYIITIFLSSNLPQNSDPQIEFTNFPYQLSRARWSVSVDQIRFLVRIWSVHFSQLFIHSPISSSKKNMISWGMYKLPLCQWAAKNPKNELWGQEGTFGTWIIIDISQCNNSDIDRLGFMGYLGASYLIHWKLIFWYIDLCPKWQWKPNNSLIFLNYKKAINDSQHILNSTLWIPEC